MSGDDCSTCLSDIITSVDDTVSVIGWVDEDLGDDEHGILVAEDR